MVRLEGILITIGMAKLLQDDRCTFFVSGPNLVHQGIFRCLTCASESEEKNLCCCAGCANYCHAGHDVEYLVNGLAYCDCGAGNCSLLESSFAADGPNLLPDEKYLYLGGVTAPEKTIPFGLYDILTTGSEPSMLCKPHHLLKLIADECQVIVSKNKETFWVGSNWQSRNSVKGATEESDKTCACMLEELALTIFNYHVHHPQGALFAEATSSFDPERSGAEWWIQVKDVGIEEGPETAECKANDVDQPPPPTTSTSAIDLHYDKDEDAAERYGVGLFPVVSTITYITACPSSITHTPVQPTVILPVTANDPVGTPIFDYLVSYPSVGKHVSFDGRLLHGAPAVGLFGEGVGPTCEVNRPESTGHSQKRITFLVNVWLNHRPAGVQRLPADIANVLADLDSQREGNVSLNDAIYLQRRAENCTSLCEVRCSVLEGEEGEEGVDAVCDTRVGSVADSEDIENAVPVDGVVVRLTSGEVGVEDSPWEVLVPASSLRAVRLPFVTPDSTWGDYVTDKEGDRGHAEVVEGVGDESEGDGEGEGEEDETALIVRLVVPPTECIAAFNRSVTSQRCSAVGSGEDTLQHMDCIRVVMDKVDILASCVTDEVDGYDDNYSDIDSES